MAAGRTERLVNERVLRSEKHESKKGRNTERDREALSQRVQDAEGLARDLQNCHLLLERCVPLEEISTAAFRNSARRSELECALATLYVVPTTTKLVTTRWMGARACVRAPQRVYFGRSHETVSGFDFENNKSVVSPTPPARRALTCA